MRIPVAVFSNLIIHVLKLIRRFRCNRIQEYTHVISHWKVQPYEKETNYVQSMPFYSGIKFNSIRIPSL